MNDESKDLKNIEDLIFEDANENQDFSEVEDLIFGEVERNPGLAEWEYNHIIISLQTYERFMSLGKGWQDAYTLYCHYFYTARRQQTNQPRANWKYCCNGIGWRQERYYRAKNWLIKNGFIRLTNRDEKGNCERDEKGHIRKEYIRILNMPKAQIYNFPIAENQEQVTSQQTIQNPLSENGDRDKNPLSENRIMGNRRKKCLNSKTKMLKNNNGHVQNNGGSSLKVEICRCFYETFQQRLQDDVVKVHSAEDLKKVIDYVCRKSDVQNPVAYVIWCLKHIDDIPDLEPPPPSWTERQLQKLRDLETIYAEDIEIVSKIHVMRTDLTLGTTKEKFHNYVKELNKLIGETLRDQQEQEA